MAIQTAGGFSQFLKNWNGAIKSMISERRYSPRLLRLCELIWELQLEQDERHRKALVGVSDDELEAVVRSQVAEMIQQNPKLAVDAAEKLGWKLTPPAVSS
ncbi:MAG: hypothetical protein ABGZ53_36805 [Fuerstiella sp.]